MQDHKIMIDVLCQVTLFAYHFYNAVILQTG